MRELLRCEEIPGQRMFAYRQDDAWREIQSGDVNDYLRGIAGDDVTAKDFRTWGASVVAAATLRDLPRPETPREVEANVLAAIDAAAERLGNTRAVTRSSCRPPRSWPTRTPDHPGRGVDGGAPPCHSS